ncbi:angiotensin-converting enzyme-like [Colletes gigas]|uniref:angiotensin-converting enzyme-like n=1 Tax=Colletes gigas TaxID=935657 RepID=UPI001C9B0106|nr:angiotensin-converting enzyme-like [Colletes gigas]XP_043265613.1 angiotensin-converting enzyme-like [Colletes gigas]XP_043265621.1 angiotensin-converting enzyme-like [Colletes gigas]
MPSQWTWIIFSLVVCATTSSKNDFAKVFIELTEFEYEDACINASEAEWAFVNYPSNKTLSIWEEKLISYAAFKNAQKKEITNITKLNDLSLQHKYDVTDKAGDALLESEDFKTLIHFTGAVELLRLSTVHTGVLNNYTRKDVEQVLSRNNNVESKDSIWTAWHQSLFPLVKNFTTVFPLVDKAAKANDAKDVTEYWELLSGYSDGYNKIKYQWRKIENLHKKVLKFIGNNLSQKYNITINDTIPAHLLGSLQGSDWTPISVDVTPYPDLMYNIKMNLWKRKLIGKSLYKAASALGTQMLNQVPHADFWDRSQFNRQCPSKLINFCKEGIMRVSTCFEPTISNFLSAHKDIGKILYNQMSVETIPVLNTANRYSALEIGVSELFGILAASPAWLKYTHIMDNSTDNDQHLIVSLMITALNTLPRLAYYMSLDMWRINVIETGITNPEDLVSSWWKYRQEYEGLSSDGIETPTFLDDDYVTSNKPYLPKLAGTILAFQFYQHLMDSSEVRYDSILEKQIKVEFVKMIRQGGADDWMRVIDKFLGIDDISSDSLLSFFSPLEDFIDEWEEDFEYKAFTAKESEFEELKKKVIEEFNAPSTTTVITTSTTSKSVVVKNEMTNKNNGRSNINAVVNGNKNSESKSATHGQEVKPENHEKSEASSKVPLDESLLDNTDADQDTKPKINTSKAVWAVGAVLLATIVICIIAIFGRQRCRKTPKNRRYV